MLRCILQTIQEQQKVTDKSIETSQKTSQKILELIKGNPNVTSQEMADLIGINRRNIARNIKILQEKGIIRRVGPDRGGHWEIIKQIN